jgi:hypothetical protein
MREPKRDIEDRLTVRSTVAAIVVAIVDHRVLFQLVVIAFAIVALRTWGPEDLNRGIDYVTESAPARGVRRVAHGVWRVSRGALRLVDRTARRPDIDPPSDPLSPVSLRPVSTVGSSQPSSGSMLPAQAADAPVKVIAPRVAPPGAANGAHNPPESRHPILWSLVKGPDNIRADLIDRGPEGVDLILVRNGREWRRERWADPTTARAEADVKRADLEKLGWIRKPI